MPREYKSLSNQNPKSDSKYKNYMKSQWYTSDYYYWYGQANGYQNLWESIFHNGRLTNGDVVYMAMQGGSFDSSFNHTMIITDWYWDGQFGWQPKLSYHTSDNLNKNFYSIKTDPYYSNANYVGLSL